LEQNFMTRKVLGPADAADVIERFLENRSAYPQEWNDFIESRSVDADIRKYQQRSYELDPLVNTPGQPNVAALRELKSIVATLRAIHHKT
jgi:hypothetical protein